MGLTKQLELDTGIILPKAYIRVVSCAYIHRHHVSVKVLIYKDINSFTDGKNEITSFSHICTTDFIDFFSVHVLNQENTNIISQAYEWLKTLDFYKDAVEAPEPK